MTYRIGCGDRQCNQGREGKMVATGNGAFCDPCLAPIVKALNDGGIKTVASCCGHGRIPATIILDGDIWLTITTRADAPKFDGDINAP